MLQQIVRNLTIYSFCVVALLPSAVSAQAQKWATRDACTITTADVDRHLSDEDFVKEARARAADTPNGVGRLWKITASNGAVSHLWGTMHSSAQPVLDLPQELLQRVSNTRLLAIEIDYRPADRAEHARMMSYEGWWQDTYVPPSPLPLLDGSDPRIPGWISERLLAAGIDPEYTDYLTPGGVFSVLLSDPCEDFNGGVLPLQDHYIQSLAHIEGVAILGMEPPLEIMFKLNDPANRAFAEALITNYGTYHQPIIDFEGREQYLALYRAGYIGAMMAFDEDYRAGLLGPNGNRSIDMTHAFLVADRNAAFLDAIRHELLSGGVTLAVGAFHLPGETGLVNMLREEGFDMRRIPVGIRDDR